MRKLKGLVGSLMELERLAEIEKAEGYPVCIECGWPSDDHELDLCCDCFDAITLKQLVRGDFGKIEQQEAIASITRSVVS